LIADVTRERIDEEREEKKEGGKQGILNFKFYLFIFANYNFWNNKVK